MLQAIRAGKAAKHNSDSQRMEGNAHIQQLQEEIK